MIAGVAHVSVVLGLQWSSAKTTSQNVLRLEIQVKARWGISQCEGRAFWTDGREDIGQIHGFHPSTCPFLKIGCIDLTEVHPDDF